MAMFKSDGKMNVKNVYYNLMFALKICLFISLSLCVCVFICSFTRAQLLAFFYVFQAISFAKERQQDLEHITAMLSSMALSLLLF